MELSIQDLALIQRALRMAEKHWLSKAQKDRVERKIEHARAHERNARRADILSDAITREIRRRR